MTTSSPLRERAAQAASGQGDPHQPEVTEPTYQPPVLEDIEYTGEISDPEKVPVHVAIARVMADVRSVGKGSTYNAPGTKPYRFRGVEEVLNAVAPAVRRHGLVISPVEVEPEYRDTNTSKGNKMRECTVKVRYLVTGPAGDYLAYPDGKPILHTSCGEALDTMDKATTKAMSVALRNLHIHMFQLPVTDMDPEADSGLRQLERGERPTPKATEYVDEICDPHTSPLRLQQIWKELGAHRLMGVIVVNEVGDEEPIGKMVERIGKERKAAAGGAT